MSSPLPLRLCCMAAMAPALTEAASQARIRLPSSPTASPTNTAVNGRDCINLSAGLVDCRSNRAQGSGSLGTAKYVTLKPTHLQNGGISLKSHFAHFGSKSKVNLADLGVITNLPKLYKQERLIEFSKIDKYQQSSASLSNTMNQINNVNGTKDPSVSCTDCGTGTLDSPQVMGNGNNTSLFSKPGRSNGLHGNEHKSSLAALKSVKNEPEITKQLEANEQCVPQNKTSLESRLSVSEGEDIVLNDTVPTTSSCSGQNHGATQTQLERRVEYLVRRLRRLQAKQIQVHTKQQLNRYVVYQNGNLQLLPAPNEQSVTPDGVKSDVWPSEDVKSLSTVALVSLVKKIQTSQSLGLKPIQQIPKQERATVLHLGKDICEEGERTSSQVCSYLRHVESAFDSDATESSSGGESSDELNPLPEKERKNRLNFTPVHRRPEWKWAVDRAGVASRWTWLQAQVSDLEYRIRQQSDIYRQIRANKGTVVLGDIPQPEDLMAKSRLAARPGKRLSPIEAKIANIEKKNEMSPCNISTLLCNVDKQSSKLAQSLGNCLSPSPVNSPSTNNKLKTGPHPRSMNGFVDRNSASEGSDVDSPDSNVCRTPEVFRQKDSFEVTVSPAVDASCQAARCRPVKSYRKRKLLRTIGLQTNRKNARLSSVKCQCYPPMTSCAMCGGRYNSTRKLNPLVMHNQEKISLLDTSTHPILSFPQDTPLPIHLEGAISAGEWQAKLTPKSKLSDRRRSKLAQLNDRKTKRYARGVGLLSSTKYRRKLDSIARPRNRSASLPTTPRKNRVDGRKCRTAVKRRRAAQLALAAIKRPYRSQSMSVASSHGSSGSGSRTPTPSPQTKDSLLNSGFLTSRELKEAALRKKRGESAYDINNIVIPYSMAAATRVTRLKYKEIVTPKWRDITTDPDGVEEEVPFESPMDVEEEEEHRPTEAGDGPPHHPLSQQEEEDEEIEDCSDEAFTQRHMKCEGQEKKRFMSFVQYGRRVRGSRTESGANSPEHLSPECAQLEGQFVGGVNDQTQEPGSAPPHTPSSKFFTPIPVREGRESKDNGFRKRSGSNSRRDRSVSVDEASLPVEMEWVSAEPWPLRTFPLPEEEVERMMAEQPSVEELRARVVEETAKTLMAAPLSTVVASVSRSSSPAPSTSTSLSEEDPNDPEWTVHCDTQSSAAPI